MMAKKTRKRAEVELLEEEILLKNIETTTKKEWYLNYKIDNQFKLNDVHNSFMELCLYKDTKMVFVDGPAGSGKSYLAVYAALQMLLKKEVNQIIYLRSIVESGSKSIGSLPGELELKFQPYIGPMVEKLEELVGPKIGGELIKNGYIKCMPVNFVRGLTFRNSIVIMEETQNMTREEIVTCITRFGENSKFIIIGDSYQSDIGNRSGFVKIQQSFNDKESEEKGIHNFVFTINEIVRSEILKFIMSKIDTKIN
jgi:phosphate starvation-inducible PhoH-like protein